MTTHSTVVWVHGDDLSPLSPALTNHPGAPAIFVFDDELLRAWKISLKRVVFIYECLLELPVTIRRGDVAAEVLAFADEHGASEIVTSDTPSPRHVEIAGRIVSAGGGRVRIATIPRRPLVKVSAPLDLRRFSRYWNAIKDDVLGT